MQWYRNISQDMDHIDPKTPDEGKGLKGHFLEDGRDLSVWRR